MVSTPNAYYRCPCASESVHYSQDAANDEEEEERDFDPTTARANFSLSRLEQLFYCDTCHQIRCPKCVMEEILCWYCPNCLFEVPSSTVRSEGTRCTRSCFECPCCQAPLSVTVSESQSQPGLLSPEALPPGPYALTCSYCAWTSEEVGLVFSKPTNIYSQLSKTEHEGKQRDETGLVVENSPVDESIPEVQFANLRRFYQNQMAESSGTGHADLGASGFGSPASLSRLMGLYNTSSLSATATTPKSNIIREAHTPAEGLIPMSTTTQEIDTLSKQGYSSTTSSTQRLSQCHAQTHRLLTSLRPTPYLLRTKRSKRCSTCRSALIRPDPKVSSSKYKLRLVATKHVPSMHIRPFPFSTPSASDNPAPLAKPLINDNTSITLKPKLPTQFILRIENPIYHSIRITLATPRVTPGPTASRITLLCPQFEIDPMMDFIDDALTTRPTSKSSETRGTIAEAGKVWDKGGNWVDVVVEVVPGVVGAEREKEEFGAGKEVRESEDGAKLEIAVWVRVEWEGVEEGVGEKVKRELAYWCVLEVGRIES